MTALPLPPMPMHDCPLCRLASLRETGAGGDHAFTCAHCGNFQVSDAALVMIETLPSKLLAALTQSVRRDVDRAVTVRITVQNMAQLIASHL